MHTHPYNSNQKWAICDLHCWFHGMRRFLVMTDTLLWFQFIAQHAKRCVACQKLRFVRDALCIVLHWSHMWTTFDRWNEELHPTPWHLIYTHLLFTNVECVFSYHFEFLFRKGNDNVQRTQKFQCNKNSVMINALSINLSTIAGISRGIRPKIGIFWITKIDAESHIRSANSLNFVSQHERRPCEQRRR